MVLNGAEPFYFCMGLGMGLGEHTCVQIQVCSFCLINLMPKCLTKMLTDFIFLVCFMILLSQDDCFMATLDIINTNRSSSLSVHLLLFLSPKYA